MKCSAIIIVSLTILPSASFAQTGSSCTNAISVNGPATFLSSESAVGTKWYELHVDTGEVVIDIASLGSGDTSVTNAVVYSGSCSGLIPILTLTSEKHPLLYGRFYNPISTIYFLKVEVNTIVQTNYTINLLVLASPPTYNPCTCPNVLASSNTTCDQVCNGSFEYLNSQVVGPRQLDDACPWRDPLPYASSSDVFDMNSADPNYGVPGNGLGSQNAHTGQTYAGFSPYTHPSLGQASINDPDYKEYVSVPLNQTLVAGQCYQLTFYLSMADYARYASGNFGVLFSNGPASQTGTNTQHIAASPQILFAPVLTNVSAWTPFTATYPANGTENYMTIGNFDHNNNTPVSQVGYINFNNITSYQAFSYYYIDDVSLTPCCNNLAAGSFPTDLCYGDQVTLAAATSCPNVTYSWTPTTNITGSPIAPNTTATVVGNQLYTCQVTLTSYGCTISASTQVNLAPTPVVNAGPDVTICEGQSVTLNGTGALTSNGWQDIFGNTICNLCSTITVSPPVTTSYVYFALNTHSGCYGYDTVTVFVNPSPQPTIVAPPGAVTCDNSLLFTAGGGLFASYSWTSNASTIYGSSTTTSFHVDWTNSFTPPDGYVTLTVTNSNGCTGSATVTIPHCCCGAHVSVVNDNVDSILVADPGVLQMQGGNWVMSTTELCVNGIFTVNQNLILRDVMVFMGTEAKIIVAPGILFRLESTGGSSITNQTIVQACDRMWDGIYVDGTNTSTLLDIRDGTVIEDAHTAIVSSNGGNVQISGSLLAGPVKLNKNDTAIWIKPFLTLHPFAISNAIISSDAPGQAGGTPTVTSPGNSCIAPALAPAKAGIVIQNAVVNIGNTNSILRRNTFERVQFGIVATSSTVTVKNNQFLNIARLINVPFSGYAIYAAANKNAPGFLTVGGSQPLDTNRFYNCNVGISCNNDVSLYCERNGFINQPNQALVGTYAIGMFFCNSKTCTIKSNHMSRWRTGIWLLDNNGLSGEIRSNWINVKPNNTNPIPNSAGLYGIRVNNAVQLPMNLYVVQNDISRNRIGIEFINVVTATGSPQPRIRYNNIGFDFNANVFNANIHYGIRVINSPETQVDIDTVCYNYKQYFAGPLPTNALASQLRGIHVENSNNVEVTNNYCNRLGAGIWMEAICPASRIACNQLVRNYNGVFLNNAVIGDQYGLLPNDNRFALTPPSAHSVNTDVVGSSLAAMNWYHRTIGGNWFVPSFAVLLGTPIGNNGITSCGPPPPPTAASRQSQWSPIVLDTINYPTFNFENRDWSKKIAFRHFDRNFSEQNLNSTDDTLYHQFWAQNIATNVGLNVQLLDTIADGDSVTAEQLNAAISCTLPSEDASKVANAIYIASWMTGQPTFSTADTIALLQIALTEPTQLGDAVYTARVMLDTFPNSSSNQRVLHSNDSPPLSNILVYPVPISNVATIEYVVQSNDVASITVINSLGQVVGNISLQEGEKHSLEFSGYNNGIYLLQLMVNSNTAGIMKVSIQHE